MVTDKISLIFYNYKTYGKIQFFFGSVSACF